MHINIIYYNNKIRKWPSWESANEYTIMRRTLDRFRVIILLSLIFFDRDREKRKKKQFIFYQSN